MNDTICEMSRFISYRVKKGLNDLCNGSSHQIFTIH